MNDVEFPLSEELKNKNLQKIIFLPNSNQVFIWYDNKPIVVNVDLNSMASTTKNYYLVMNGLVESKTRENLLLVMSDNLAPYMHSNGNDNSDENDNEDKKKKTKIQVAFDTVRQQASNLFIDEYRTPHIAIPIQDHTEVFPVNSNSFENWYRMYIFERDGTVLDIQTINDLCSLASAYAASPKYGAQINLSLRTASNFNFKLEWNYDLTNKNWEFIKITSNDWQVLNDGIFFRRYNNQQAQVYPDRDYEPDIFDKFMKLVNIKADDKDSILLLKCYVISLFIPDIQKAVLILHGSQGAAKSSLQELIKMLVDPSIVKTLTFPRDLNELIQQLSHNYVTYYDNVSIIKSWISDQLCRAVSGSGSSKRKLYTDDDDIIRSFKRCIGINGINLAATKPDLLDRSIIIKLERIEDGNQRSPEDIWEAFEEIRSQLVGYILDILVKVLAYKENNPDQKFKLSRMTEFAKYGEIIARCMGYKDDDFIEAYKRNKEIQTDEIVDSSQVATVIMCMMFEKYGEFEGDLRQEWIGTPTELYGEIKSIVDTEKWNLNIDTKDKYWPKSASSLIRRLNEIIPTLKEKDLEITYFREPNKQGTKKIKIRKIPSEPSEPSEDQNLCSKTPKSSDGISDNTDDIVDSDNTTSSENNDQIVLKMEVSDV
jgi:hypothetical protein